MPPTKLLAFGMPGGLELLIILVIVLLLFGRKIPGLARSLGSGITEFKKGLREGEDEARKLSEETRRTDDTPRDDR